jgi:ferritin
MISKTVEQALNNQISMEANASNIYLAMASWCDKSGLPGCARFLYMQSEEERMHMLKLFTYVNETGGHALAPEISQPTPHYKSVEEILSLVLAHEQKVTKSINALVELCWNEKDYSSFNFLQWFVSEQHEEEHVITALIDKVKIVGERGLYWIDKEMGKMKAKTSEKSDN